VGLASGTYVAQPDDDGEDLGPLYKNEEGMTLFKVVLGGGVWWGIGPFSRATYRWIAFVAATESAALPPMGTTTWLQGGSSTQIDVSVTCQCPYADVAQCGSTTVTSMTSTTTLMHSTSSREPEEPQ